MRVSFYVDGFNFYYGCIKGTAYKWLDFGAFCQRSMPGATVARIRYFTAIVKPTSANPDAPNRQLTYLRALETIPGLTVHRGQFLDTRKSGMALDALGKPIGSVTKFQTREEKGTDVNIASHLLADAFRGDFDQAVLVTNDSDLVEPIKIIRSEIGLDVTVLSPHNSRGRPSFHLQQVASQYRQVDRTLLPICQLGNPVFDANNQPITKPLVW